jgi:hypothetical protein
LRVDNRSRRDIRSADFDQDKPLVFDLGADIVMVGDPGPATFPPETLQADGTKIRFGPTLIPGGASLRCTLITEGAPHLTCQSPLVNVKLREQGPDMLRPLWAFVPLILTGVGAALIASGVYSLFGHAKEIPDIARGVLLLGLAVIILAVASFLVMWRVVLPRWRRSK